MHRQLSFQPVLRSWPPRLSPPWVHFWKPARRLVLRWQEKVHQVQVKGLSHLREALASNHGVLLTPNHFTYADPFILQEAAERAGSLLYFLSAGQIFASSSRLKRLVLQQHGAFSLDREGDPRPAFRTAVELLRKGQTPLVIFPEGEMFHFHDRVAPFQQGPARIALAAARHRPVVCVPCALNYRYLKDPRPQLVSVVKRLERYVFGRREATASLAERVRGLVEVLVTELECAHVGRQQTGPPGERIERLIEIILGRLEADWGGSHRKASIPERVKHLQRVIGKTGRQVASCVSFLAEPTRALSHSFQVMQLFSYPADYFNQELEGERLAEVIDKLEEDFLGVPIARPRAPRQARITILRPIVVQPEAAPQAATRLTRSLEQSVHDLLGGCPVC